ncbi:hypothetical protein PRIPAC_70511 [Pristionchus pacificus]|uniref:Uncharacterized protein n=1 Tax=Pristionchus pacificus TaxID=54126 RepID=A0A454XKA5_PRIPA|nr:hypothetical protein PRIPAC_70511 [Pristionchus pacificus]|eukprot:PDM71557.1 hypothetical protein PRIPAC_37964 [Pristionchus pacificus]
MRVLVAAMSLKQISEDDPTGSEVMNLKEFIKSMELVERQPGSRASSAESSKPQTPSTKGPPKITKRASAFELLGKKMTGAGSKEKGLDKEKDNFSSLDDMGKTLPQTAEEESTATMCEAKEKLQKVARSAAYVKNIRKMESVPAGLGNGIVNK